MKVTIVNEKQVVAMAPQGLDCLISITEPGRVAPIPDGWGHILRLQFHDVISTDPGINVLSPFTENHADKIIAYTEKYNDRDFYIHCHAGMSRSVAVGVWMRDTYDAELILRSVLSTDFANGDVLRTLNQRAWKQHFAYT